MYFPFSFIFLNILYFERIFQHQKSVRQVLTHACLNYNKKKSIYGLFLTAWAYIALAQLIPWSTESPYGIMEYFQILVSCMMYRLAKSWNFVVCGKSSSSLIFRTSCHTRGEMIDDGPMSSEIRERRRVMQVVEFHFE